jgi:hypothetical protein
MRSGRNRIARGVLVLCTLAVYGGGRVSAFWAYELGAHSSPERDAFLHARSAERMAAVHARLRGHVPNRTEWLAAQHQVREPAPPRALRTRNPKRTRCTPRLRHYVCFRLACGGAAVLAAAARHPAARRPGLRVGAAGGCRGTRVPPPCTSGVTTCSGWRPPCRG